MWKRYNRLPLGKKGPYRVSGVCNKALSVIRNWLENTLFTHLTTLRRTSRRHCHDESFEKFKRPIVEEPCSDREPGEHRKLNGNTYIVGIVLGHVGSGASLRYVKQLYSYSEANDTIKTPYHIPYSFIDSYRQTLDRQRIKKALMEVFLTDVRAHPLFFQPTEINELLYCACLELLKRATKNHAH